MINYRRIYQHFDWATCFLFAGSRLFDDRSDPRSRSFFSASPVGGTVSEFDWSWTNQWKMTRVSLRKTHRSEEEKNVFPPRSLLSLLRLQGSEESRVKRRSSTPRWPPCCLSFGASEISKKTLWGRKEKRISQSDTHTHTSGRRFSGNIGWGPLQLPDGNKSNRREFAKKTDKRNVLLAFRVR